MPRLAIPNQTVKRLMYGFLRDGYKDVGVFRINLFRFEQLLMAMANEGAWRPVLEFLSEAIARQTGIRDYIAGEKVIQGFWPLIWAGPTTSCSARRWNWAKDTRHFPGAAAGERQPGSRQPST